MEKVDVLAVVGSCPPERERSARRLAETTGRMFVSSSRLALSPDPVEEAIALAPWCDRPAGVVFDIPGPVPMTDLIGALADPDAPTRLIGVICIADAAHLLEDLHRDGYLIRRSSPWQHPSMTQHTAHALLTVMQLEYASTIVLVNWESLPTDELSTLMALVSSLSPLARLRLEHGQTESFHPRVPYTTGQERPGWVCLLNDRHEPHMTDRRVSAFRYENVRPLHPGRLHRLLDRRIERGEFGMVIRSTGFCRLATRPGIIAQWDHVGRMISFAPVGDDDDLGDDEELLAFGQDLAIIGLDLHREALSAALDEAALSDAELSAGPDSWARFADPFPSWRAAPERSE